MNNQEQGATEKKEAPHQKSGARRHVSASRTVINRTAQKNVEKLRMGAGKKRTTQQQSRFVKETEIKEQKQHG